MQIGPRYTQKLYPFYEFVDLCFGGGDSGGSNVGEGGWVGCWRIVVVTYKIQYEIYIYPFRPNTAANVDSFTKKSTI